MLGKTIGAGSMGKVKLARKEDGSEQVCLKSISGYFYASFRPSAMRINLPLMPPSRYATSSKM